MRTIGMSFKRSGKYFVVSMAYLLGALFVCAVYGADYLYRGMNGYFGKYMLRKPFIYVWRSLTWGTLVWAVFTYVFMPFLNWWDGVVAFLNYVIWGVI